MQTATETKSRVLSKREQLEWYADVWKLAYLESFRCTSPTDAAKATGDANTALKVFKAAVFGGES